MATRQIVIEVPEKVLLAEKTDEVGFSRELPILAAVKLYELGRLSSGRAAELAGMTRVEFLLSLNRYRVFPLASELEDLRMQGLALGGSMRNAVLLDDEGVVNADGLRFVDEFVRHKILDCLGDLALAEAPIFGHLYTSRPGHRLNNALLRELFAHRDAWRRLGYDEIMRRIEHTQTARIAARKTRAGGRRRD